MAKSPYDLTRLCEGLRRSSRMLQRPRQRRYHAIELYIGDEWGAEGNKQAQPLNLISLWLQLMLRALVPKNPRTMYSTFQQKNKPTVNAMQIWANKSIERMNLADVLRRWAMDACFSVGILKVALATPSESAAMAWGLKAGSAYAKTISLDDWYVDPNARDKDEIQFCGHQYRVPLDTVRDDGRLYGKGRKELKASSNLTYNDGGDERTQQLGRGTGQNNTDEVEDMVDLVEVYCPRHRSIKTLALDQVIGAMPIDDEPLREQQWLGPDWGPYHWMRFGIVPDNLMPKAPIQDLVRLHEDINGILRKLTDQADRQKTVLPVNGVSAEDMERLTQTNDGFAFRCDNPNGIKEVRYGGPDQQNFTLFLALKDLFSFMGGNLELLGGRGAQSATATQDKMLNENAGVGVADMQDTMITGTAKVCESLGWYWLHDPYKVMRATFNVPGMPELSAPLEVTPQQRMQVPWDELEMSTDPFSMQHKTPQMKLAELDATLASVAPMMGLLQQGGTVLDAPKYLEFRAKYTNNADIQELFTLREPPMNETGTGGAEMGPEAATERTYNRVSTSEQTNKGMERNMMYSGMTGKDPGGQHNGNGKA